MEEIWKDIKGYEGLYQVSNLGRVFNVVYKENKNRSKYLNGCVTRGYVKIYLTKDGGKRGIYLHRLVGQAFLGLDIKNTRIFVCHKDDNPSNNNVDNLFLGTARDNSRDMINKGRSSRQKYIKIKLQKGYDIEVFDRFTSYNDGLGYM